MLKHYHLRLILFIPILLLSIISFTVKAEVDDDDSYYLTDPLRLTEQEEELLTAVENYDFSTVQELLSQGVNPNIKNKEDRTPLMIAAQKKDVDMAKLLLENGADINYRSKDFSMSLHKRRSALDYAVLSCDTTIVNYLLNAGAELNPSEERLVLLSLNPVIIASQSKNIKMIKYLLDIGCKVSKEERQDIVALNIKMNKQMMSISNNNNGELLIRFWMNYGTPLQEQDILESQMIQDGTDSLLISKYMKNYNNEKTRIKEEEFLSNRLSLDFALSRKQELEEKRKAEEDARMKELNNKWKEDNNKKQNKSKLIITFLTLLFISIAVFIYRKYLFPQKTSITPPNPQQPQSVNKKSKKNVVTNKKPKKSHYREKYKPKKPSEIEKGWEKDDTVHIEISFLTIEDMINPIRLKNEHEKAVRDMIQHIRILDRHTDQQIEEILGEEGLTPKLNSFWDKIRPEYVREVYKKSLYIILENYSKRDSRVLSFLKKLNEKKSYSNIS